MSRPDLSPAVRPGAAALLALAAALAGAVATAQESNKAPIPRSATSRSSTTG